MDDTAAGVAIGLLTALVLHGALNRRAAHAAERQVGEAFSGTGLIHAVVREQAPFGVFGNDLWAIDVYADHVSANTVPLEQFHRSGWKGRIHHLRLHLVDCGIAGLQFSRLDADIPSVTYDLGRALYKDRLLIRGARPGRVSVSIEQSSLASFALRKYGKALKNIKAAVTGDQLSMTGDMTVLSASVPFTVDGQIAARAGRYLEVKDPLVTLNGKSVDAASSKSLLDHINPVLDVENDLHLGEIIHVQTVMGQGTKLIIDGEITVPFGPTELMKSQSNIRLSEPADQINQFIFGIEL
jgi:hypothetical protein